LAASLSAIVPGMTELIRHQYDLSACAEKICLALGLKGVAWRSAHHPLVMMGLHEKTKSLFVGADSVGAWMQRVTSIGHGQRTPMDVAEAISIARAATPVPFEGEAVEPPAHIFWNRKNARGGLELVISMLDSQRRKKGWAR
jgi:hypothetical protein